MQRIRLIPSLILATLLVPFMATAATITWTNGVGDGLWSTPGNWSTGTVPGAADLARFNGSGTADCLLNINLSVGGIEVQAPYSGTIHQQPGRSINVGAQGWTQAGGTFSGSDAAITVAGGNFKLLNGSFTSTSGTLRIGGTRTTNNVQIFEHAGGTFDHNNGTVEFDPHYGTSSGAYFTVKPNTSTWFYNLTINARNNTGTLGYLTVLGSDTLKASNDLVHRDGRMQGNFLCQQDLYVQAGADGGEGKLIIAGNTDQTYYTTNNTARTAVLIVDKPAGKLQPGSGTLELNTQGFRLLHGEFVAPEKLMRVGGTWSINNVLIFEQAGGDFHHNNGTVELDPHYGTSGNSYFTVKPNASTWLYNLVINARNNTGTLGYLTVQSGDTLKAQHDLVHRDGRMHGTFLCQQDLRVEAGADGGEGRLIIAGTTDQNYYSTNGTARTAVLIVDKPAGKLQPAPGTHDLSTQGFRLIQGEFFAPDGLMRVGGTWSANNILIFEHAGGDFHHNNGTVELDPHYGTSGNSHFTVKPNTSTWLYNLTINARNNTGTLGYLTVQSGDTLKARHDLVHRNGRMHGTFVCQQDLYLESGADGGEGEIILNGAGDQFYQADLPLARTATLVVDKTSGLVQPANATTGFSTQGFRLLRGDFTAPARVFIIGGSRAANNVLIFEHAGGDFHHNNGTVELDPHYGTSGNSYFTVKPNAATWLYNLTINARNNTGTLGYLTVQSGDTLKARNDIVHRDGRMHGIFICQQDLYLESGADGGEGEIIMNGTGDQFYQADLPMARTATLVIDKTTGQVQPTNATTGFSTQGFRLLNGDFTAPTGLFRIGGTRAANNILIFEHAAGDFHHNNGTVELDPHYGTSGDANFKVRPNTSTWLYNLTISARNNTGTLGYLTVQSGDTLKARHDLMHRNGRMHGIFVCQQDLYVESGADGGEGEIILNGAGDQFYQADLPMARTATLVVDKATGLVQPANATTGFSTQGFRLLNGDFTAPAGLFLIGGTRAANNILVFEHAGGDFHHNNGTVELDPHYGTSGNANFRVKPNTSTWLYNLTISARNNTGTLGYLTVQSGDTLKARHDLVHRNGRMHGIFVCQQDLYLESGADGGEGEIILNGTGDQFYQADLPMARTATLVVDKATGLVQPASATTGFSTQGFRLLQGDFTAPADLFRIGGTRAANNILVFEHAGGDFHHNNGTVELDPHYGTSADANFRVKPNTSTWLYNLTISARNNTGTLGHLIVQSGDTLKARHDLVHSNGVLDGSYLFEQDLYIQSGSDGGQGELIFGGSNDQAYTWAASLPRSCRIKVFKPAGTAQPASGAGSASMSAFCLAEGTFVAPSGILRIGGTSAVNMTLLSYEAGTFDHGNGQTVLDPGSSSCTARSFTLAVTRDMKFNDLRLDAMATCGASTFIVPAAGALASEGHFELARGRFNGGAAAAEGPVTVEPAFLGGTGALIFEGTNDQTFDLTGAEAKFDGNITLNKTDGNVELLSALTMDLAGAQLSLQSGRLITTATNLLTIARNVTATPGQDNSFVDGPLLKIGNNAFVFPIGKGDSYAPIAMSAPAATTSEFIAEYWPGDPEDAGYDVYSLASGLDHLARCEYWSLDRTVGTSNVQVTLYWDDPRSCGVTNPADLRVARWDGSQWANHGNGGVTYLPSGGNVRSSGAAIAFGPFTLASSTWTTNPLPVELLSFNATVVGRHVELEWATASEKNSSHYIVERSKDAATFEEVLRTPAAGNSSYILRYEDVDPQPFTGLSYYRLKQVDLDGTSETFNIVPVRFDGLNATVYPNPTNGAHLWVSLESGDGPVIIELIDPLGRTVINRQAEPDGASQLIDLGQDKLAKGTYQVRLTQNGTVVTKKVVVM